MQDHQVDLNLKLSLIEKQPSYRKSIETCGVNFVRY